VNKGFQSYRQNGNGKEPRMEKRELQGVPNKKSSTPPATMPRTIHGGKDTPAG